MLCIPLEIQMHSLICLELTNEYRNLPEQEKIKIIKIAKYEREENPNTICN